VNKNELMRKLFVEEKLTFELVLNGSFRKEKENVCFLVCLSKKGTNLTYFSSSLFPFWIFEETSLFFCFSFVHKKQKAKKKKQNEKFLAKQEVVN